MAHEELLARTDFFGDAPAALVRDLAAHGSELHLIRGDVIFREGDVADALYLVISFLAPLFRLAALRPRAIFGAHGLS